MELRTSTIRRTYRPTIAIKMLYRLFDIAVALVGCAVALILALIVKIAYVRNGDKDPIIFTQERIGLNGNLFKIYKFRTMVPNADQILFDLMESDEEIRKEYEKNKKLANDPRITKLGHKLRKTSLDEFPQFFNVLKGDMTIVGPRPYLPREANDMGSTYDVIVQCKPAITGPWQVGGRSDVDFEERCQIDINYIHEKTIKTDIKIFIQTITSVLKMDGAK